MEPVYSTSRQVAEAVLVDARQRHKLRAYARERFSIPAEDAEDLLQDTAVELLRQRLQVHNPEGFLFAVFRARCCRYIERDKKANAVFSDGEISEAGEGGESGNVCSIIPITDGRESIDRQVAVKEALGEISVSCRRLLKAYYAEGKSLAETAHEMARAASGIGKTFSRCLRYLRRCLS
jgi:RNA polymerase sigma factor (sigma-70 family)